MLAALNHIDDRQPIGEMQLNHKSAGYDCSRAIGTDALEAWRGLHPCRQS